jgi:hypothetical protein
MFQEAGSGPKQRNWKDGEKEREEEGMGGMGTRVKLVRVFFSFISYKFIPLNKQRKMCETSPTSVTNFKPFRFYKKKKKITLVDL